MGSHNGKRTIKNAKLTPADVEGIRWRLALPWNHPQASTTKEEADRYEVGVETIRRAARGETYRDVGKARQEVSLNVPKEFLRTDEEIEESKARVMRMLSADGDVGKMLEELEHQGRKDLADTARAFGAGRGGIAPLVEMVGDSLGKEALPGGLLEEPEEGVGGNPLEEAE